MSLSVALAGFGALLSGCDTPAPVTPPPPSVEVMTIETSVIDNVIELPGRVQAVRTAEVRARVTGIVDGLLYREGTDVKAGQPLFAIDRRELEAALSSAQAVLRRAEANAQNARQDVERFRPLRAEQAISEQEYDAAVARMNSADADVMQARAQVDRARLDLGYATVTAPISGRAGRAEVTEGALVSAGSATLLTRIEQLNPIYVNFSQSSSDVIAIRQDIDSGRLKVPALSRVKVELTLEDGSKFQKDGRLDFIDLTFDEATGSAALRAEFPNPQGLLVPGQFVRARILAGERDDAILVPQRAVNVGPRGGVVMVVTTDSKAEARPVVLGDLIDDRWVVKGGLKPGEQVIVSGLQKVRPGQPVRVAGAGPATGAAPSAMAAPAAPAG